MKKAILVLVALIVLSMPVGAYAATLNTAITGNARGFCGVRFDPSTLTEEQKEDLDEAFNKMIELKKETINKMVQNGLMTEAQGDLALERLEEMVKYHEENGFGYGMGMMGGYGNGRGTRGGYGRGMMNGYGNGMMIGN